MNFERNTGANRRGPAGHLSAALGGGAPDRPRRWREALRTGRTPRRFGQVAVAGRGEYTERALWRETTPNLR